MTNHGRVGANNRTVDWAVERVGRRWNAVLEQITWTSEEIVVIRVGLQRESIDDTIAKLQHRADASGFDAPLVAQAIEALKDAADEEAKQ